jgi:beta-galactosidase
MKYSGTFKLVLILVIILNAFSTAPARETILLQTNWKFAKGNFTNAFKVNFDDSQWQNVSIPHDWAISGPTIVDGDGNTGKLPWKGEGWYRKRLDIPASYASKRIYLLFDGIMAFPDVYMNGKLVGKWDYGYNSFYLDITEYLQFKGNNILAIHVDTREHDSRWYPGAGIYRKVEMIVVDPIHVGIWGTYITTPIIKPNYADVRIMASVYNKSDNLQSNIKIQNSILNPTGKEISTKVTTVALPPGTFRDIEASITLTDPLRWDIDNPVLYQVKTTIYKGNEITDVYYTPFGIRTIRFTADNGFYLNDKRVQLKGVNLHHDHGPLGASFFPRAMERQLEIMKSMGCNAIRTSHNVPAPELLDQCDRMGFLVLNEAFDKYDNKIDIIETTNFEDYANRNIRNFVLRDRNHPSIFLWSVGNEIYDVSNNLNNGFLRLQIMINYVRKYDITRPVTLVCDDVNSSLMRHFDYYDVHSWNYGRRYLLARQMEPNKAVIITESASTVSTRGFYEMPLPEEKTDFTRSLQVSSYDLNTPPWAEIPDDDFMWQQEDEFVAGEFVWTGFDYLGEPTPYTNSWSKGQGLQDKDASRSSYFGIVDLCGIPKDRYYLYKSYWKPEETTIHILPHWNWQSQKTGMIPVFVYTNGDCAELFLNGQSLGMKCKNPSSKISTERFRLQWPDVKFIPGELKAVAYKEGTKIGESILRTAGEPYELRLTADRPTISADGMDLSYILVETYDRNGNFCPLADNKIDISVNGPGHIAGVGNGDPQSFESFQANQVSLFYGKAMIIIGSDFNTGEVTVSATSPGLVKDTESITIE